jgi:ornithine carbamoyltransferase
MAYAWMYGCAKMGIHFVAYGPAELEVDQEIVKAARAVAAETGGKIEISSTPDCLKGADVIYTDVWASMGEEAQIPEKVRMMTPYKVTMDMMKATENPHVLFMHCLPAFHDFETKMAKEWKEKGYDIREVEDEVFRSRHSVVFDEAENRMHTIKAVIEATIA